MAKKVDPTEVSIQVFAKWMEGHKVLIVDPSVTSRSTIGRTMTTLGLKASQLIMVNSYVEAEAAIEKQNPRMIVADFDLGKRCGLDLLQRQRQVSGVPVSETFFILVTGNTSQSAVAKAAEEDVDSFIIKPFNAAVLKSLILKAAMFKVQPPQYYQEIEKGKKELKDKHFDEAMAIFEDAAKLDNAPALSYFYQGQTESEKQVLDGAEEDYLKGLQYNKIHYKCLVGLFENLMSRKRYADAYSVIKRVSQYFPANPQRMTQVLRLAIMTKSYEDVERYYQIFTTIDDRNEEMIKYVCAALVVCGKYYLQQNHMARARELFQKAATTANGRTRILREIIIALVDVGMAKNAQEYLQRFPATTQQGQDFLAMQLLVNDELGAFSQTIKDGAQLLGRDMHDPVVYRVMIRRSALLGNADMAEDLVQKGIKRFPDQANFFKDLLKANLRTKGAPAEAAKDPKPANAK